MTSNLDLSTGKEHRISVGVGGWNSEDKSTFEAQAQKLDGVTSVQGAGGGISFYVYYDPAITTEAELSQTLSTLATSIGVFNHPSGDGAEKFPSGVLTTNEEQLGIGSQHASLGDPDQALTAQTRASTWTGMASVQERVVAFKQLAPIALAAVDNLIAQLETSGHNGGPPLEEHQEAIDALRSLHVILGNLLSAVEKPGFQWVDAEGMVQSCAHFAIRSVEKLKNDPLPFAVSGLALAVCSVLGFPSVGGWLAAATFELQKRR